MNDAELFPRFDDSFNELNAFLVGLVKEYEAGRIKSWGHLETRVRQYFEPDQIESMESQVPGWKKMASYSARITLVHVMCVFLGMLMLPEFKYLTPEQQQLAKWIVLLHDVDKFHIRGKRDTMHAFRSGIHAANLLPDLGFRTRPHYHQRIDYWSEYTARAFLQDPSDLPPRPDNRKLPGILMGIENLFGRDRPAALITKTVLLHISLDVDPFYTTPAPLTDDEIRRLVPPSLLALLRVMMLSDNEGWSLFDPETRARQRRDTLQAFERIEPLISPDPRE